jgi:hypothetical protein
VELAATGREFGPGHSAGGPEHMHSWRNLARTIEDIRLEKARKSQDLVFEQLGR